MRTSIGTILLTSLLAATATGQRAWIQLQPSTSPPPRGMCAFVAMTLQNKCVMFGGEVQDPGTPQGDTWTWNGANWTQLSPSPAPQILQGSMAMYDIVRDRVVLFSGWNGNAYIQQTWEFDGTAWANRAPATQPPARDWGTCGYDLARGNTLLFGGHIWSNPNNGKLADTWTWDGTTWTQHAVTGPPARWGAAMAFDPARGTTIMFGGDDVGLVGNDMWEWNGSAWSQITPATVPPPRHWHTMTYHPGTGKIVMIGGEWNDLPRNDCWEWDGVNWTQVAVQGGPPAGGYLHGAALDPVLGEIVQFGGDTVPLRHGSTNQTWMLVQNGANWATWGTYGTGCGKGNGATFYEQFTGAGHPFDLANGGWFMLPSGPNYVVVPRINAIVAPSGAPIAFGDDQTQAIALPWTFPTALGGTPTLWVCSNGWISLQSTTNTDYTETVPELLSGTMRITPLWDDLNPTAGGSTIHAEVDPGNPSLFHVTYTGVPEFSATGANTFQLSFDLAGTVEVKYGAVSSLDSIVGYTPGNGAADPGGIDISAIQVLNLNNDLPALGLRAQNGARPVMGTNFGVEITGVPPTGIAAAILFSLTQVEPGIDLTAAGFGGCALRVGSGFSVPTPITGSTAAVSLSLPNPSGLQGVTFFLQGACIGATNVSPLPVAFSNGGAMRINPL